MIECMREWMNEWISFMEQKQESGTDSQTVLNGNLLSHLPKYSEIIFRTHFTDNPTVY